MTFNVSNESGTDIYLYVGGNEYLIEEDACNFLINCSNKENTVFVKRVNMLPLPNYKKMLTSQILGGVATLFIKPQIYVFDVSSKYSFIYEEDKIIDLKIIAGVNGCNPDYKYDMVCITSPNFNLSNVEYFVENKTEISNMYKKCCSTSRIWMYSFLEILFSLIGIAITYPLLFMIYSLTKVVWVKVLFVLIPVLIIGLIALIGILPLHCFYKYQDKNFYHSMEHKEIKKNTGENTGDGSMC